MIFLALFSFVHLGSSVCSNTVWLSECCCHRHMFYTNSIICESSTVARLRTFSYFFRSTFSDFSFHFVKRFFRRSHFSLLINLSFSFYFHSLPLFRQFFSSTIKNKRKRIHLMWFHIFYVCSVYSKAYDDVLFAEILSFSGCYLTTLNGRVRHLRLTDARIKDTKHVYAVRECLVLSIFKSENLLLLSVDPLDD